LKLITTLILLFRNWHFEYILVFWTFFKHILNDFGHF